MVAAHRARALAVRPLAAHEADRAVAGMPGSRDERLALGLALADAAAGEPLQALGVFEGRGDAVAVALGGFVAHGYQLTAVWVRRAARRREAVEALLGFLRTLLPGGRVEVVADLGAAAWLRAELERAGLAAQPDQQRYGRDLRRFRPRVADPFEYRAYRDLGRAEVTELLTRIRGERPSDASPLDAVDLLDAMLYSAAVARGGGDPTALWHIAFLDGEPAGVAFGAVDDRDGKGTLLYVGLVPQQRGVGLGRALHAHALARLREAGAGTYDDATAAGNTAMRRVFERNGCRRVQGVRVYGWEPEPPPERLAGFEQLVAHVERRGWPHSHEGARRLRVRMRFAHLEADVEVVWARDARVVEVVRAYRGLRIAPGALDRLARSVCAVNAALELPGFALDAERAELGFRAVLPAERDGGVATATLARVLREAVFVAAEWEDHWHEVAGGGRAHASLLTVPVSGL